MSHEQLIHAQADTPINRATINQLTIDEFDQHLMHIREKRMAGVRKIEVAAKAKASEVSLDIQVRFNKQEEKVKKKLETLIKAENAFSEEVNKLRILQMELL